MQNSGRANPHAADVSGRLPPPHCGEGGIFSQKHTQEPRSTNLRVQQCNQVFVVLHRIQPSRLRKCVRAVITQSPQCLTPLATEIWFLAGKNCFFSNGVARYQLAEDPSQCFCNCFWYLHQSITKQVIYIHPSAFWKHQPRLCVPISEACTTARQPLVYLPVLWTRDLHHQLRWGQ